MWSNETSSPSIEHTRWYLIRPPSLSCSWLNRTVFSSVAGNTRIGIETSPKEMAPFHMVLGISFRPFDAVVAAPSGGTPILRGPLAPTCAFVLHGTDTPTRHQAGTHRSAGRSVVI